LWIASRVLIGKANAVMHDVRIRGCCQKPCYRNQLMVATDVFQ